MQQEVVCEYDYVKGTRPTYKRKSKSRAEERTRQELKQESLCQQMRGLSFGNSSFIPSDPEDDDFYPEIETEDEDNEGDTESSSSSADSTSEEDDDNETDEEFLVQQVIPEKVQSHVQSSALPS